MAFSLTYLHMWGVEIRMAPRVDRSCSQEEPHVSEDTAASQPTLAGCWGLCMTGCNGQSRSEAGSSHKGLCKRLQLHTPYPQHHVSGHFSSSSLVLRVPGFQGATCSWVGFKSQLASMTMTFIQTLGNSMQVLEVHIALQTFLLPVVFSPFSMTPCLSKIRPSAG